MPEIFCQEVVWIFCYRSRGTQSRLALRPIQECGLRQEIRSASGGGFGVEVRFMSKLSSALELDKCLE